jgi:hypothetical protein
LFTVAGYLKSEEKEPTSGFPETSIITLSHLLLHHSTLGVTTNGILKNRVAAITFLEPTARIMRWL